MIDLRLGLGTILTIFNESNTLVFKSIFKRLFSSLRLNLFEICKLLMKLLLLFQFKTTVFYFNILLNLIYT